MLDGVTPGFHKFECRIITEKDGIYIVHRVTFFHDTSSSDSYIPIGKGIQFVTYSLFEKLVERPRFKLITPENSVKLRFSHLF